MTKDVDKFYIPETGVTVLDRKTVAMIGDTVSYVRHMVVDDEGNTDVVEGEGQLHGVFINEAGRLMARIHKSKEDIFNVNWACVNPSAERVSAFKALVARIEQIKDDGNAQLKSITEEANKKIEETETTLLGRVFTVD